MISLLLDYWWLLVVAIAIIVVIAIGFYIIIHLPKSKKAQKVKEWLLYAVVQAEKELGSGTGQLKLRYVYNLSLAQFPIFTKIIPFEAFSELVDGALNVLEQLIADDDKVKNYVNNIIEKKE